MRARASTIAALAALALVVALDGCGRRAWYGAYGIEDEDALRAPANIPKLLRALEDGYCQAADEIGRMRAKAREALPDLVDAMAREICFAEGLQAVERICDDGPETIDALLKLGAKGRCEAFGELVKRAERARARADGLIAAAGGEVCAPAALRAAAALAPDAPGLLAAGLRRLERIQVDTVDRVKSLSLHGVKSTTELVDDALEALRPVVLRRREEALEPLVGLLGHAHWEARYGAAMLLAALELRSDNVLAALQRAKEDRSGEVRRAAEGALKKLEFAAMAADERTVLALFDVADPGGLLQPAERDALTDELLAQLAAQRRFRVVPRAQVRSQLDAQKVASYQNGYDEKTQVELGRALNAGQLVVTGLSRLEGGCAVTATLFDIAKSATERSASVRCACTAPAFTQAMAALAGQLAGR
ncbi:MAG TPA: hypothetical protein PK668_02530 [Myxococcota bacterium]|nr:hypothetical protein [Myxococcota bacterium]HRY94555.1 hypothetical protein [Myxococcota bacterium]HSA20179.1 hypothetical protein [Myxococcota bacterium]